MYIYLILINLWQQSIFRPPRGTLVASYPLPRQFTTEYRLTVIFMIFQPENMDQHRLPIVNFVKHQTGCAAPDTIRLHPCTVCRWRLANLWQSFKNSQICYNKSFMKFASKYTIWVYGIRLIIILFCIILNVSTVIYLLCAATIILFIILWWYIGSATFKKYVYYIKIMCINTT